MAVSRRTDGDAGVAVEKNVAVDVFNPNSAAALGHEFKGRSGVGRVNKLCIRFDDLLAFGAWRRRLNLRTLGRCEYAGRHFQLLVKMAKNRPNHEGPAFRNRLRKVKKT